MQANERDRVIADTLGLAIEQWHGQVDDDLAVAPAPAELW
jgi:hypothetical protein